MPALAASFCVLFACFFSLFLLQLLGVVGVVVVISAAIPVLTVAMLPVLGLCFYYANRYLQVINRPWSSPLALCPSRPHICSSALELKTCAFPTYLSGQLAGRDS